MKTVMKIFIFIIFNFFNVVLAQDISIEFSVDDTLKNKVQSFVGAEEVIKNYFIKAASFYQEIFPELLQVDDLNLKIKVKPSEPDKSKMEVENLTGKISIFWDNIYQYLPNEVQVLHGQNLFAESFMEAIAVHELGHKIHYKAYEMDPPQDFNYQAYYENDNKDFREFIASMLESLYLIKSLGLNWYYRYYVSYFLSGDYPPFEKELLRPSYYNSSKPRRWSIFTYVMLQSQCWKNENSKLSIGWNKTEKDECLNQDTQALIEKITSWIKKSIRGTNFLPLNLVNNTHINSLQDWGNFSQELLLDLLNQSEKRINSQVLKNPIFSLTENIKARGNNAALSLEEFTRYTNLWYQFRFHHMVGFQDEQTSQRYQVSEI